MYVWFGMSFRNSLLDCYFLFLDCNNRFDWFLLLLLLTFNLHTIYFWFNKKKMIDSFEMKSSVFFLFVGLFPLHLAGAYSAALPTTYGWVHFHFFCSSVLRLDEWTPCREIKSIFKLKKRTNERKKECLFEKQNIRVINRIWWKTTLCVLTHTYGSDDDVMFK